MMDLWIDRERGLRLISAEVGDFVRWLGRERDLHLIPTEVEDFVRWLGRECGLRFNPVEVEDFVRDIFGCPDINDLFDYVDGLEGRLGASRMRWMEEHVKTCPECWEHAEGYRQRLAYDRSEEGRQKKEALLARIDAELGTQNEK